MQPLILLRTLLDLKLKPQPLADPDRAWLALRLRSPSLSTRSLPSDELDSCSKKDERGPIWQSRPNGS